MNIENPEEELDIRLRQQPVPGEGLTVAPGQYPYERPSTFSDPEALLDSLFVRIMEPRALSYLLTLMDNGTPVELLIESLVESMVGEGVANVNLMFLLIPPLVVILTRVADAAGVKWKLATDQVDDSEMRENLLRMRGNRISNNQLDKAMQAVKKSSDIPGMTKKMGLMTRPEAII